MDSLQLGREAFGGGAWGDAYRELAAADAILPLAAEDLELLFVAAYLTGHTNEFRERAARAFRSFLSAGDIPRAVRCAFNLVMHLSEHRELAQAGGWLGRARTLLDDSGLDCVEQGYVLVPVALQSLRAGDAGGALSTFVQVGKMAKRFGDDDLLTISKVGRGNSLLALGEMAEGVACLDEAMVAVTSGELSPIICGFMYCAGIETCHRIFDMRRGHEWTAALSRWCASQPDIVSFRGECLAYRVEVMRLHGSWADALDEARQACELLKGPPVQPAASQAYYQQAELHRLGGELGRAEECYRLVSRLGGSTQPGLAQLRLAQGEMKTAESSIRLAVDEARSPGDRARLLAPYVEILLAVDEFEQARGAAGELNELAAHLNAPLLAARAAHTTGSVLLSAGEAREALGWLREAWFLYRDLDVPYEGARTRALLGLACRQLGDEDTAQMELDAAGWVFRQLGAVLDQAAVDRHLARRTPETPAGLTDREVEVLRLVAAGKTNREIAGELFLSQKTVARHLSNIFTKLDVNSRSAATAFAFQHDLIEA